MDLYFQVVETFSPRGHIFTYTCIVNTIDADTHDKSDQQQLWYTYPQIFLFWHGGVGWGLNKHIYVFKRPSSNLTEMNELRPFAT